MKMRTATQSVEIEVV